MSETNATSNIQEITIDSSPTPPKVSLAGPSSTEVPTTPEEPKEQPAEPTPEQKKEERVSSKFALLAKKERQLREKQIQAKELAAKAEAFQKAKEQAKTNPLQYLQEADLSMDEIVSAILKKDTEPTKEEQHEQALKTVNEKLQELERREQEKEKQAIIHQQQQEIKQIQSAIDHIITSNSDQYEAINLYNRSKDVFDLMFSSYEESNGKITLTIEQAAKLVEDQLQEEAAKEAERLAKLKRFKEPLTPKQVAETKPPVSSNQPKTLTNTQASAPAKINETSTLSREESLKQAAKLLKFN